MDLGCVASLALLLSHSLVWRYDLACRHAQPIARLLIELLLWVQAEELWAIAELAPPSWREVAATALNTALLHLTALDGDEKALAAIEAPADVWTPKTRTALGNHRHSSLTN